WPHLLGSSRRDEPRDGLHGRVFFEDAGGVAVGVPVDGAGGGVGCGPSDVRQFEGKRIGDSIMAGGMHEPDGIVGGHGIEIGGGDIASFSELRSEEHTSELQSRGHLVCRLLLEKKKQTLYST